MVTRPEAAPPARAPLVCPRCAEALTAPVEPLPDDRLLGRDDAWDPWVPQGAWARVMTPRSAALEAFPLQLHPHDLRAAQVTVSGFGCCGYTAFDGPNLRCRCGEPVGFFVDECSMRIELCLAPHWGPPEAPRPVAGLRARLHRLSASAPADVRCYPGTQWDWDIGSPDCLTRPRDFSFALLVGPGGLAASFTADGVSSALVLPPHELARAVALRRLPVGDERLALSYGLRDHANRVMTSWTLLRRGDDVVLAEETGARARGWQVWGEWFELAWAEAVDRWEGSALAIGSV